MVSKKTRIGWTLLVLNFLHIHAFETDKCGHENLTTALGKLHTCWDSITVSREDICGQFEETRECIANNLDKCFHEENIKKTSEETLAELRSFKTAILLTTDVQKAQGFNLSEAEVDSLFSVCPNIPDKTFIENIGAQPVFVLEPGVRTDNNCTEEEITDFNAGSEKCLESELDNTEAQFTVREDFSHPGSNETTICLYFDRVVGKCLRKTLPSCFSMRERIFLRSNLEEQIQYLFKKVMDLAGEIWPELDCSVFSGSVMTNPRTSIAYILFAISLFYIII